MIPPLLLFITVVGAEWELPFDINVNFLKHIGGFSPLISSTYLPKNRETTSRDFLAPLPGSRIISTVGSSTPSCVWNCFDSSSFPSPLSLQIDPVNASSECPPYSPNEPILPPIKLPAINPDGSCSTFDHHVLSHTNTSIACIIPFGNLLNPSKCDLIDTVLLSFWSQLDLPDSLCNCDKCTVPLIQVNSTRNETDSKCYVTTGIELSITQQRGVINSFVIREREMLLADSSLTSLTVRIDVRFYEYHPPSETARFWTRRHHIWCPSEVSCPNELWYPLSLLSPLSWQTAVAAVVGTAVILILIHVITRRSLDPSHNNAQILNKCHVN